MAKLTSAQRKAMPQSEYALPGKRFPINDRTHAVQAERMANRGTTPAEAAKVKSKAKSFLNRLAGR